MSVQLPEQPRAAQKMLLEVVEQARDLVRGQEQHFVYEHGGFFQEDIGNIASSDLGPKLSFSEHIILRGVHRGRIRNFLSASDYACLPDGSVATITSKLAWIDWRVFQRPGLFVLQKAEVLVAHSQPSDQFLTEADIDRYDFYPEPELARAVIADVAGQIAAGNIGVGLPL